MLPLSGCSTFLKAIANQRSSYRKVTGDVHYGGITAKQMSKRYMGEVAYSEEDDNHHATLTVQRTIDFALRLKAPAKGLPGSSRKEFRRELREAFLKAFNMTHTKPTLVGSSTVRGVSGGERKRVSIVEALCAGAAIVSWDNSSRGLDASTALDYAKSMRILTDLMQSATFISLYQASEAIWEQFDKVLVIDEGRCIYYGPRTEARRYFIDLGFADRPRQPSADYITGCTDDHERIFQEGRDEHNTPGTPEQLEEAYKKSSIFDAEQEAKRAYDHKWGSPDQDNVREFEATVQRQKHFGAGFGQYTVPFWEQVSALFLRQLQMLWGDRFDILMSYVTAIVGALLTGGECCLSINWICSLS